MKLVFILVAVLSVGNLYAQHRRADFLAGGVSALRLDNPYDDLIYRVGYMFSDRMLIGFDLRADSYELFNTYNSSSVRGDLFARYYLSRNSRLNPYLELGTGALTDDGIFLALRPATGAEVYLSPGVFGRVAVSYGRTSRGEAYTLEVGSTVSLSGWSNKDRIPSLLQPGEVVINSHLASLSMVKNENYSDGLYGTARIEADLAIGSRLLFGTDLRYVRTTLPYVPLLKPADITSLSAGAEVKFRFLRISNFIDPYAGVGILYARSD